MMRPRISFSSSQARALHLAAQGLLTSPRSQVTREDVRRTIVRMELLQIDTIHVVARSPYLVLFSRLGAFDPRWLDELLESGRVFECWAHEACLAPIEEYGLHRRISETRDHWFMKRARRLLAEDGDAMRALLAHVTQHGPVRTADFVRSQREGSGWWSWKKEKSWLEAWFALGELMIARRVNFHRVYDLRSRVHPAADSIALPSAKAAERELVERTVRALGVTQARWIHDYFRTRPRLGIADLEPLIEAGTLVPVEVEGWSSPGIVHRDHVPVAKQIAADELAATHTTLLSPFDPVVWDRDRLRAMFGFDYRLECYLPARKRRFGYYVLPILRRGQLVGRLDAKAHRAEGIFEVKALSLEAEVRLSEALLHDVAGAIGSCAAWHGTPHVRTRGTLPTRWRAALAALLSRHHGPVRGRAAVER